jgi:hypothetical protein
VIEDKEKDIEILLKSVELEPVPPALREKVLGAARRSRIENRAMTPRLWRWVACCTLILAVVLGLDAVLGGRQMKHIQSYLGGVPLLRGEPDMSLPELAKDLDESADPRFFVQARRQLAAQRKIQGDQGRSSLAETSQEVY